MGVFDKIKNALFEEEYVEVEEKPKKPKRDLFKKDAVKDNKREEKPIAKKVVLPEKKEIKVNEYEEEELIDEDFEIKPKKSSTPKENTVKNNFKIMEDSDFKVEPDLRYSEPEPKIVKVIEKEETNSYQREEKHYYDNKPKEKQPYGISDSSVVAVHEYGGAYEKKDDKTYFKPSPIISPIYGILDKNYKKEDVVTKREVRLTSSYARENLSVDDVRKKAYGSLNDDLVREIEKTPKKEEPSFKIDDESDNLLVDLSADDEKPAVKEVTMGDALEYFQDLGLEYNVDYVDASKEKATGRREKAHYDEAFEIEDSLIVDSGKADDEEVEKITSEKRTKTEPRVDAIEVKEPLDVESDDNLFDLIDSMYKEED